MDIRASGADAIADRAAWDNMLANGMTQSSTFRELICEIASDVIPSHRITINLGRDMQGLGVEAFVDQFATNNVDLNDLVKFPISPPSTALDGVTQPELIVHFLAERLYAGQRRSVRKRTRRWGRNMTTVIQLRITGGRTKIGMLPVGGIYFERKWGRVRLLMRIKLATRRSYNLRTARPILCSPIVPVGDDASIHQERR